MIVFAHRGASAYETENSVASIKKALQLGTSAIEIDVQMTKDRKLVLHHDFKLKNSKTYIRNITFDELIKNSGTGDTLDSLENVISLIPDSVILNIEIKSQARHRQNLELDLLKILEKYHRLENTIISSFDHHCIKKIYKLNKQVKLGLLFYRVPLKIKTYIKNTGITPYCINFSVRKVNKDVVESVHNCGSKIFVYTVNNVVLARKLQNMGVDGIFSDYPDILK